MTGFVSHSDNLHDNHIEIFFPFPTDFNHLAFPFEEGFHIMLSLAPVSSAISATANSVPLRRF